MDSTAQTYRVREHLLQAEAVLQTELAVVAAAHQHFLSHVAPFLIARRRAEAADAVVAVAEATEGVWVGSLAEAEAAVRQASEAETQSWLPWQRSKGPEETDEGCRELRQHLEEARREARVRRAAAAEARRELDRRRKALGRDDAVKQEADAGELEAGAFARRRAATEAVRGRLLGRLGVLAGLMGEGSEAGFGREQLRQLSAGMDEWLRGAPPAARHRVVPALHRPPPSAAAQHSRPRVGAEQRWMRSSRRVRRPSPRPRGLAKPPRLPTAASVVVVRVAVGKEVVGMVLEVLRVAAAVPTAAVAAARVRRRRWAGWTSASLTTAPSQWDRRASALHICRARLVVLTRTPRIR